MNVTIQSTDYTVFLHTPEKTISRKEWGPPHQYVSNTYSRLLKAWKCTGSMSRKDNCRDNAVAESFFGSLKQEQVHWCHYQTRYEAQQDILNYITMFYNSQRLHSG